MSNQELNVSREEQIALPSISKEKRIAIRMLDWNRIKRYVSENKNYGVDYSIPYSILYGVSGSSGLTLIPLFFANGLPAWVIPLYICVTIFSLFSAILLTSLNGKIKKMTTSEKKGIADEMLEIEETFNEELKL